MSPFLPILSCRQVPRRGGVAGMDQSPVSDLLYGTLGPAAPALPACLPAWPSCLRCSCCPLLCGNGIACVQPEGVTVADLLKEDKKKRRFCCFRRRRAKDHGNLLRWTCSLETPCLTCLVFSLSHRRELHVWCGTFGRCLCCY